MSELRVTDLATAGGGHWPCYRIPALTTAGNGDLLAFFDGRPTLADLPGNLAVVMRRSADGGASWSDPEILRGGSAPAGYGDPSVVVDRVTGDIFVFHAASTDAGFWDASTGSGHEDPAVQQTDYSVSRDDGHTWEHHRITADLKRGHTDWAGMFAASGEGIQLRSGPRAGRLIQQYVVRIGEANHAVSVFSDDHGATWRAGEPTGPGADENKVAELSDGSVLLISRAAPARLSATSSDGGATYAPLRTEPALVDPGNNGCLIRAFPDAAPADPRARMLLHSNTADPAQRRNLTVRLSYDDGHSWPVARVLDAGRAGYSTLTPLRGADGELGGSYGLLYERGDYAHISYASFDLAWVLGA